MCAVEGLCCTVYYARHQIAYGYLNSSSPGAADLEVARPQHGTTACFVPLFLLLVALVLAIIDPSYP